MINFNIVLKSERKIFIKFPKTNFFNVNITSIYVL